MLTHISCFSGIGGADLAAEWAGFQTILQVEIDPFCQAVLKKHWPDVPLIGDVRNVTKETVTNATSGEDNQRISLVVGKATSKGRCSNAPTGSSNINEGFPVTLLTAGVPCQPASAAGKRRGKADDRWLWPEAIRILGELQPSWAVFENPAGIGSLGELGGLSEVEADSLESLGDREAVELDNICRDVEAHGYAVKAVCIPACAVGAPHRRDRMFIIGHSYDARPQGALYHTESSGGIQQESMQRYRSMGDKRPDWAEDWATVASRLCALDDGLPGVLAGRSERNLYRVQKLKALGNAIVPAQIYPIFKAIYDIEKELE